VLFHLDLSTETRGIFGPEALAAVKNGVVIVNTARIALTDEQTLVDGLESGILGGVGLDARLSPSSPIWAVAGRENVIVTPHVGWYSEASLADLRRATVLNTIRAFDKVINDEGHSSLTQEVKR
jgi:phosphoglycerate dehydrogenase-like enzyme